MLNVNTTNITIVDLGR